MNELWGAEVATLSRALQRFFRKRVRDEADDLLQQTFVQLVESQQSLRDERARYAFAFAIARRVLFAHFRRLERRLSFECDIDGSEDAPGLADDVIDGESQALFRLRVANLPKGLRDVVQMSFWDGMSRSEIADSLGVPSGTVASRLRRSLGLLRQELQDGT